LVAEHICREGNEIDSAYTASLLHSIGQLALFEYSAEQYKDVLNLACSTGDDLLDRERYVFGVDHADLGGLILDRWNLPASIIEAVAAHHVDNPSPSLLASVVHTGCFAAEYTGFGTCGCHARIAAEDVPAPVARLIDSKYLLEVLPQEVNGIECSLL
jgi:HD-like signal output (HDOD) protein